jgi:hypothetical protein
MYPNMHRKGNFIGFNARRSVPLFLLALCSVWQLCSPTQKVQAASIAPLAKEQSRPSGAAARSGSFAAELDALADSGNDIYELAQAGKMERLAKKLELLKKNAAALSYIQDQPNNLLLPRLGRTISDLEQAVGAKDRLDTMRCANRITLIAATVAVHLKPNLPTEVSLLEYNGRELGIWSEAKKTDKLSGIVMRMHLAWQTLMPRLVERNGIKELRRFSEIMGRLELARTPEEYGRFARQATAEIDDLKAIFAKPPK